MRACQRCLHLQCGSQRRRARYGHSQQALRRTRPRRAREPRTAHAYAFGCTPGTTPDGSMPTLRKAKLTGMISTRTLLPCRGRNQRHVGEWSRCSSWPAHFEDGNAPKFRSELCRNSTSRRLLDGGSGTGVCSFPFRRAPIGACLQTRTAPPTSTAASRRARQRPGSGHRARQPTSIVPHQWKASRCPSWVTGGRAELVAAVAGSPQ